MNIFYYISLPLVLYLELLSVLGESVEASDSWTSIIFFPPNTPVLAYSIYVSFTVVSFVLLSFVQRSKIVDASGEEVTKA